MILKASQRASGQNLAVHLMRDDENDHVLISELRGFAGETLHEAFLEAEAISHGTKCRQYLFSLSMNPPEGAVLSAEEFSATADRIEKQLGLAGQPRALVIHEKEGRCHAHCVWSRIDADSMTARHLPYFKNTLNRLSRDLYLEHGWQLPDGLKPGGARDPKNFTLAEWQQSKRLGTDPRILKDTVQGVWTRADDLKSLRAGLEQHGLFLAKGDRRGVVVLDAEGGIYALSRLAGVKTKDVRARFGDGDKLKSVADTQELIARHMTPTIKSHLAEAKERFAGRAEKLDAYKAEMRTLHRAARQELNEKLVTEWDSETKARAARLPKGLKGLWHRITGHYQAVSQQNEQEAKRSQARQAKERQALIEKQMHQRAVLQERIEAHRQEQAKLLRDLRRDLGRYLEFSRSHQKAERGESRASALTLNLTPK